MDSATEFLFGRSVDSMSSPLPLPGTSAVERKDTESTFVRAFIAALGVCAFRINIGDPWPLWELKGDASRPHMKVVYDYLNPIVDEAINKKKAGTPGEDDENTLLGHLAAATNGTELSLSLGTDTRVNTISIDRKIIRDELLNILLAGRDTVRSLLAHVAHVF